MNDKSDIRISSRSPDSFNLQSFGGRLGYAMMLAGATLQSVGNVVGISRASVSRLCAMTKERTSSTNVPEIAAFLGVSNDWLSYGAGEVPTHATLANNSKSSIADDGASTVVRNSRLTGLQLVTLEKLEALMMAGSFDDIACLELLNSFKEQLTALEAAARSSAQGLVVSS